MKDAPPSAVVVTARLAYALCGALITFLLSQILQMDPEVGKELALLNAGVAYYTHEAAGKVVRAINGLYTRVGRNR